jgi:hypothetical protein
MARAVTVLAGGKRLGIRDRFLTGEAPMQKRVVDLLAVVPAVLLLSLSSASAQVGVAILTGIV